MNLRSIPETIEWLRRIGYKVRIHPICDISLAEPCSPKIRMAMY